MRFEVGNLQLFGFDLSALFQRRLRGIRDIMPTGLGAAFLRPAPSIQGRVAEQQLDIVQIDTSGRRTVIVSLSEDALNIAFDRSLRADVIRNIKSPRMLQVQLLMPESQIMRRTQTLPYQARHNLRDIVAYQASRLTPFGVDKLFFDVKLLQENHDLGTIEVEFIAVLKTIAQPWIDHLERLTGCIVSCLGVCSDDNSVRSNLFGKARVSGHWWRRLNHNSILIIVLTLMLLVAAITPVYKARVLVLERKQEIALLDKRVVGLLEIRNILDDKLIPLNNFIKYREQQDRKSNV